MAETTITTLDEYGYPPRPDSRGQRRKTAVRASKRALLACIALCLNAVGFLMWLARIGKRLAPMTPESYHPRRILVIRLDLIGDLVLSTSAVRALKHTYPEANIDLLAMPSSANIVASDPDLSQVITYDPNIWRRPKALFQPRNWRETRAVIRRLRARHYDLAVSLFGPWAAILAVLSGAKRRVGYGEEGYFGFMTDNVAGRHWKHREALHEVDYCLRLTQRAGAKIPLEDHVPRLYVDNQAREDVERLLLQEGVDLEKPLIACHVSSNNGQSKRWPVPYWATLADRLARERDAQIVLTGAPGDLPLIELVTRRMKEHAFILAGKTSLPQLAALLERADLLISGDSGPMHIAGAVGTPLIAIHGPTDPAHSGPVSPFATILRSDIWCSPCYYAKDTADCRFFTTQCMKNVTPNQVSEVVQQRLREKYPQFAEQEAKEEA